MTKELKAYNLNILNMGKILKATGFFNSLGFETKYRDLNQTSAAGGRLVQIVVNGFDPIGLNELQLKRWRELDISSGSLKDEGAYVNFDRLLELEREHKNRFAYAWN